MSRGLTRPAPVSGGRLYRRSPHLVYYWKDGRSVLHNYATGRVAEASAFVLSVLECFDDWHPAEHGRRAAPQATPSLVRRLVERLRVLTFLERDDRLDDPAERAMRTFDRWNPAAGFFHTATKNVRFIGARQARALQRRQARRWPVPPAVKRYPGAPLLYLPLPADDEFARVLRARRTWRRFSSAPLPLASLATLLGLTGGVQRWVRVPPFGDVPLKTSPSGGARHPIELYIAAWNVRGLRAGLYHYAADRHALELLRRGVSRDRVKEYLPHNPWFADASALVLFTAVFERQLWRYPYARAYRAALIEAGHLAQTFCLTATSLGLAPFSLMALADSAIERDLGIDGVGESVLYAAGVGGRPKGAVWAPLARGSLRTRPNPYCAGTPRLVPS